MLYNKATRVLSTPQITQNKQLKRCCNESMSNNHMINSCPSSESPTKTRSIPLNGWSSSARSAVCGDFMYATNWSRLSLPLWESSQGKGRWRCYRRLRIFAWTNSGVGCRGVIHCRPPAFGSAHSRPTPEPIHLTHAKMSDHCTPLSIPPTLCASPITLCSCFMRYLMWSF